MKLSKITRRQIRAAKGRPVEISWPPNGPEPKKNHRYTVQTDSNRAGEAKIIVRECHELPDGGFKAIVQVDGDPVRLLGRSGGYSSAPSGAIKVFERTEDGCLATEGEAVDARYQGLISEEGQLKTILLGAKQRAQARTASDERRLVTARSKRSERTIRRHLIARKNFNGTA